MRLEAGEVDSDQAQQELNAAAKVVSKCRRASKAEAELGVGAGRGSARWPATTTAKKDIVTKDHGVHASAQAHRSQQVDGEDDDQGDHSAYDEEVFAEVRSGRGDGRPGSP